MELTFLKRYFQQRKTYRRVFNELASCTDRELQELGFFRVDIHSIAMQAAQEESAARARAQERVSAPATPKAARAAAGV